jgi:hypothetical protein
MDDTDESRGQDVHDTLLEILDEAIGVDAAASGKIRILDPRSGRLEISVQRGLSDGFVKIMHAVDPNGPIACARAFRLRHRVAVPDVAKDPHSAAYAAAADGHFKAVQSTPLIGSGGRPLGTLSTHFARVHHPSKAAGLVLDYLARKAAAAIESAPAKRKR